MHIQRNVKPTWNLYIDIVDIKICIIFPILVVNENVLLYNHMVSIKVIPLRKNYSI